ncbi:MAG: FimB/Mfa2 family fimbrial subunit [Muribaculaceae bacterium]|nr:FimB/Mfa2 family fimbrial subunit [Muribaculaceae bacterium]
MKLSDKYRFLLKGTMLSALVAIAGALTSCDSVIFDEQGDCSVHYRLSFRYTKNILNADAFGSQVTDVNVAIYDSNGTMVYKITESRDLTTDNDFFIDVDIDPGRYDIVAWCEGQAVADDAISFTLEGQNLGDAMTLSGANLPLSEENGTLFSDKDIKPLYYGSLTDVEFPDSYGIVEIEPIPLTRDTNRLTVQLQNLNGAPIDPAILDVKLEGSNSSINYENQIIGNTKFTYTPWYIRSTYSDPEMTPATRPSVADGDIPNGVQAELSTGRFMVGVEQQLTISLKDTGDKILSIPLVQYLLLVRGQAQQTISAQDYLDRYVEFSIVFFIDEAYVWDRSKIYINNWRVVPPQNGGIQYED